MRRSIGGELWDDGGHTGRLTDEYLPPKGPDDGPQMLWDGAQLNISAHWIVIVSSSPPSFCPGHRSVTLHQVLISVKGGNTFFSLNENLFETCYCVGHLQEKIKHCHSEEFANARRYVRH
jgi:hypothetical protein